MCGGGIVDGSIDVGVGNCVRAENELASTAARYAAGCSGLTSISPLCVLSYNSW